MGWQEDQSGGQSKGNGLVLKFNTSFTIGIDSTFRPTLRERTFTV